MKKVKKIISVLLIFTMLLPLCITANAAGFSSSRSPTAHFMKLATTRFITD